MTGPARRCAALLPVAPGAVLEDVPEASLTLFVHVTFEGIWKELDNVTSVHYGFVRTIDSIASRSD